MLSNTQPVTQRPVQAADIPARPFIKTYLPLTSLPFYAFHLVALFGVIALGWSWSGFALAVGTYFIRMFVVTAVYHRYFSHRTFKTSRAFQFVMALLVQTSAQKGVLWWAAHHRWHHKHSDMPQDVHSAKLRGFWYSHMGWILGPDWDSTDYARVADLAKFRELVVLNHPAIRLLPAAALAGVCFLLGGAHALIWGFFVSTVLLWHGSFTINSLSHMFGRRRYETTDESRNNWFLALLTLGEGWHNNHHHFQSSVNQGFRWYEVDVTYYLLRIVSWTGVIWDLRMAPPEIVRGETSTPPKPATVVPLMPPPPASES